MVTPRRRERDEEEGGDNLRDYFFSGAGVAVAGALGLAISSKDFVASSRSALSALAAPGSPGRTAKTSLPSWPKVTFSSFFPSSNFTSTTSAGLSTPVFAVESTNELARMFDSFDRRPSIFSLSTSPGFGLN